MSWILAIFAALTPLYVVRFVPVIGGVRIPTTALELAFFVVCAAWVWSKWHEGGRNAKGFKLQLTRAVLMLYEWRWAIGLFVAGSLLGILAAANTVSAIGLWRAYILEPLVLFIIARDVLRSEKDKERMVTGFAASLAIIGALAIYQKFTGFGIPAPWQEEATRRVTALYGFPNAVGLFSAPLVILCAARAVALIEKRSWRAVMYVTASILGILACLFAVSEGALFGMAVGFAVLGLSFPRLRTVTLLGIIAACIAIISWPTLRDYTSIAVTLRDAGGAIRAFMWHDSLQMVMRHPFLGVGFGNYPIAFAPFRTQKWIEIFQYPHNIVLNFWSEMGMLGLIGFIGIIVTTARRIIINLRERIGPTWISAGVFAALATILVHGLVDVPYFKNDLAMLFWLLIALA